MVALKGAGSDSERSSLRCFNVLFLYLGVGYVGVSTLRKFIGLSLTYILYFSVYMLHSKENRRKMDFKGHDWRKEKYFI